MDTTVIMNSTVFTPTSNMTANSLLRQGQCHGVYVQGFAVRIIKTFRGAYIRRKCFNGYRVPYKRV